MGLITNFFSIISFTKQDKRKDISKENIIYNLVLNQKILDINIRTIKNSVQKFNMLTFKQNLENNNGFRLIYSKGFNTFGFKWDVDVIFCNRHHQVISLFSNLKPNKIPAYNNETRFIFVLANNSIKYLNIEKKDILKVKK